jgi:hypothetical protein
MRPNIAKPSAPSQDKRWKIVDVTMRRVGQQSRGLIETLHTVQEAFGYLDETALRLMACRSSEEVGPWKTAIRSSARSESQIAAVSCCTK